jgi:Tfp pilus assembly protein PilF
MKKGNTVDVNKKVDYTIVNPGKLSWQRQIDVCQRCHLQGNAVLKPNKSFSSFKPGMVLSETFDQFSPEYEDGEDFVMAAHAERFQKSKCFISSNKSTLNSENTKLAFTCISCHNPHVSVRKTNTIQFNKTCISCHQEKKCTESLAKRNKQNDNCVACHMPISGTADIPHVSVHDHYIRKPNNLPVKKPSKLKGLRCITSNSPDVNTVTEAYVSYFEKFEANPFYLNKAKENSKNLDVKNQFHVQTLIHLYYLSEDYKSIVNLSNNYSGELDAWSNYRIAKAFEKLNNLLKAESFLAKAIEQNNKSLDFILQYAVLEIKLNKWKQAESLLLNYNKLYSKSAEVWAYIGLVRLKENRLSEAKSNFLQSLKLDPDQAIALQNLSQIYLLSNPVEAEKIAKRIAALKRKK